MRSKKVLILQALLLTGCNEHVVTTNLAIEAAELAVGYTIKASQSISETISNSKVAQGYDDHGKTESETTLRKE